MYTVEYMDMNISYTRFLLATKRLLMSVLEYEYSRMYICMYV